MYSLDFPYAHGGPSAEAQLRVEPEDFLVDEELGFEPSGQGEHLYLLIEKRNQNTRWVAALLAQALRVDDSAVGFCGLKDRRAITRQWFSVHLPGAGDTLYSLGLGADIKILRQTRHQRKLRRGMHWGNRFEICLRRVVGRHEPIHRQLEMIAARGVPNYFGEQRFGHAGQNLNEAERILADRTRGRRQQKGGIYLSAARSYLFNQVLARRVDEGSWRYPVLEESSPQGPLWGRGRSPISPALRNWEADVLSAYGDWCHGLEHAGLKQERRELILRPDDFSWHWRDDASLCLCFRLPAGCYATAVLRELARWQVPL